MTDKAIFNEMHNPDGSVREPYRMLDEWLATQSAADLKNKMKAAEVIFRRSGITFNVYGSKKPPSASSLLTSFPASLQPMNGGAWNAVSNSASGR